MHKQVLIVFLILLGGQTLSASLQSAYPQTPGNISEQTVPADIRISYGKGLTINNLNKFVVRYFEDQALSGLKPNSDKTVTNPSLKAGVSGYTPYWGFSPDGTTT